MSSSKFTGSRGIHPIKIARARIPGWTLTTEIPGTPYSEPAYTSIRPITGTDDPKTREVLGVAYLITDEQYVHLVASEGGGIAYADIAVPALPVTSQDERATGKKFVVRTLGTILRRSPGSSPSARYMVGRLALSNLSHTSDYYAKWETSIETSHGWCDRRRAPRRVLPVPLSYSQVRAPTGFAAQDWRNAVPCVLASCHATSGEDGFVELGTRRKCSSRCRPGC